MLWKQCAYILLQTLWILGISTYIYGQDVPGSLKSDPTNQITSPTATPPSSETATGGPKNSDKKPAENPAMTAKDEEKKNQYTDYFIKEFPAANAEKKSDEKAVEDTSNKQIFQAFLILAVLIIALYGIYRFLSRRKGIAFHNTDLMSVLATTTVALNKYVQMIEIDNRIVVIGVADHSVNRICEITDKETVDRIKLNASRSLSRGGVVKSFDDLLGRFTSKKKNPANLTKARAEDDLLSSQQEMLSMMEENRQKLGQMGSQLTNKISIEKPANH